jgi:hypothetical protein
MARSMAMFGYQEVPVLYTFLRILGNFSYFGAIYAENVLEIILLKLDFLEDFFFYQFGLDILIQLHHRNYRKERTISGNDGGIGIYNAKF